MADETSDNEGVDEAFDLAAIELRQQQRKGGSGHSPTCIGWTADPTGEFSRPACTCAVGYIESDVDDLLGEVKRLRALTAGDRP
jgi:hypothetical protein